MVGFQANLPTRRIHNSLLSLHISGNEKDIGALFRNGKETDYNSIEK